MDALTAEKVRVGNRCPCIEANGVVRVSRLGEEYIVYKDADGTEHDYPSSYGTRMCKAHDLTLPPDCADAAGDVKEDAPAWCGSRWCYVYEEVRQEGSYPVHVCVHVCTHVHAHVYISIPTTSPKPQKLPTTSQS